MARDQGVPGRHVQYTGGQGHQTLDLQGALPGQSRGHAAHDNVHRRRPRPKLGKHMPIGSHPGTLGAPEGGGPR